MGNTKKTSGADRSRWYVAIRYDEDERVSPLLESLSCEGRQIGWILHPEHVETVDGKEQTEKAHYHLLIHFDDAKTITAACKNLWRNFGDEEARRMGAHTMVCENARSYAAYMTHSTEQAVRDGKPHIPADQACGDAEIVTLIYQTDMNTGDGGVREAPEQADFRALVDFIESSARVLRNVDLYRYADQHGYYSAWRRNAYILNSMIRERNEEVKALWNWETLQEAFDANRLDRAFQMVRNSYREEKARRLMEQTIKQIEAWGAEPFEKRYIPEP